MTKFYKLLVNLERDNKKFLNKYKNHRSEVIREALRYIAAMINGEKVNKKKFLEYLSHLEN